MKLSPLFSPKALIQYRWFDFKLGLLPSRSLAIVQFYNFDALYKFRSPFGFLFYYKGLETANLDFTTS